jgi:isopentenyldiphosphate isomerase
MSSHKQTIIIVDDQDKVIGHKERGDITADDIYRVTALWVTDSEGDILLAQRAFTKKHDPGKWGPAVAGTVEQGESYRQSIIKETAEELGLTKVRLVKGPKHRVSNEYNFFCQWYTLTLDKPIEQFTVEEGQVAQVKWFNRDELLQALKQKPEIFLDGIEQALVDFIKPTAGGA